MARCLMAAARTVKSPTFLPYSLQCTFISSAQVSLPVTYHVDRVRESKRFFFCRVRATQTRSEVAAAVVEVLISFTRQPTTTSMNDEQVGESAPLHLSHQSQFPRPATNLGAGHRKRLSRAQRGQNTLDQPFEVLDCPSPPASSPTGTQCYRWLRARVRSRAATECTSRARREMQHDDVGMEDHQMTALAGLVFMSDHRFIGVAIRAHRVPRFSAPGYLSRYARSHSSKPMRSSRWATSGGRTHDVSPQLREYVQTIATIERDEIHLSEGTGKLSSSSLGSENAVAKRSRTIVATTAISLSHTIHLHQPWHVWVEDNWLLSEMECPWSEAGRALVTQRIWTQDRKILLATCSQEGLIKLEHEVKL